MSNYEPLRKKPGQTLSGQLPSTAYPIGKAMMISDRNAATGEITFALASGICDGFLTRESRQSVSGRAADDGNPRTDTEILFNQGLESPFLAGDFGSIERLEALVVEGDDYIMSSGTGSVSTGTAAGTKLSFKEGRFYVAQTGDLAQFELKKQMTPETGGATRIAVEEIPGYLVP